MGKTKKLIELDEKTIAILEGQAKMNKRSLKNFIEWSLEETALRLAEPSEEYKSMIDVLKKRDAEGKLKWYSSEEIKKSYGR